MSDEDLSSEETAEEALKWPLPFNVGVDKFDILVKAFFQAEADRRSVSLSDLAERTGIHIKTMRPNIKFLLAVGIVKTEEEKKDAYLLTEKGTAYAKALSSGDISQSSTILKELLVSSYLKGLVDFVEIRKSSKDLNFELLFSHIKTMARLKEDPKYPRGVAAPYSAGISTLIDLLIRAGLVPAELKAEKEPVRAAIPIRKVTAAKGEERGIPGLSEALPFTINITVEAKDPESIKQLINLIRELKGQTEKA